MELIILLAITVFVILYRMNPGGNVYAFLTKTAGQTYDKYAPYSFKMVRQKVKELGQEYSFKDYVIQVVLIAGFASVIAYLYFYSIIWALVYAVVAISFVPYLAYLRCQRIYSEYIFEQIQTYTTNVIMEFNTTQSFVKSLEGVRDSGVLEEPLLSDVKTMIDMSYANGTIDEALKFMSDKYPYYMVKNMHQLFLQITNEGAKDSGESIENMMADIDALVEGVYRDKMDRAAFYKKFVTYGLALYLLIMLMQFLLGTASYMKLVQEWYIRVILHCVILINSYFLYSGTKFYNEEIGAE